MCYDTLFRVRLADRHGNGSHSIWAQAEGCVPLRAKGPGWAGDIVDIGESASAEVRHVSYDPGQGRLRVDLGTFATDDLQDVLHDALRHGWHSDDEPPGRAERHADPTLPGEDWVGGAG